MKRIEINDKTYHRYLWVATDCTQEKFEDWLVKKYGIEKDKFKSKNVAELNTITKESGVIHYYIWIEEFDWLIWQQAAIAHEMLHFVFSVMEKLNIKLSEDSEEAFTYYFENIMIEIWDKLKVKHKDVIKKRKKTK